MLKKEEELQNGDLRYQVICEELTDDKEEVRQIAEKMKTQGYQVKIITLSWHTAKGWPSIWITKNIEEI